MIVLGIDPGLTQKNPTGLAVVNLETMILLQTETVPGKSSESLESRLSVIWRAAQQMAATYNVNLVAYELPHLRTFAGKQGKPNVNPQTVIKLAHIGGLAVAIAARLNVPTVGVQPSQAKAALTGHGDAEKADMCHAVSIIFSKWLSKDAADAVGVAMAGAAINQQRTLETIYQEV